MVTCRVFFFGQNFWQTGGLKKKREAVRLPKSREAFNSRRENHMYAFLDCRDCFRMEKPCLITKEIYIYVFSCKQEPKNIKCFDVTCI